MYLPYFLLKHDMKNVLNDGVPSSESAFRDKIQTASCIPATLL